MESPSTWTPLHYELSAAACGPFSSVEQKAAALLVVLDNHKIAATQEEVLVVVNRHAQSIEDRRCGLSLQSMLVNTFQK